MDREKVIKGLECCMGNPNFCDICPYAGTGDETHYREYCNVKLIKDAIALLKAQEPRVLTLEEIDALGDDAIVWLEYLYTINGKNTATLKPAIYQADNSSPEEDGYYCVVSSWGQSGYYHKDNYCCDWRCWTSRPTDEQRRNEPWND